MELGRHALFNLLRMNWLIDKSIPVEPWQVEDYRKISNEDLLQRCRNLGLYLDRQSFLAYADHSDSPEDLTDILIGDTSVDPHTLDKIFLLLFELWRRFVPEKRSLSIFCDELDHLILSYDHGELTDTEALENELTNLLMILDENVEQTKIPPKEIFQRISNECANDLENFLYDFISTQIEAQDYSYALELIEGFEKYVEEDKWFTLLRAKIKVFEEPEIADSLFHQLIKKSKEEQDLEFNLELLSTMVEGGKRELFHERVKKTIPLLKIEEDFRDLLTIAADFYQLQDLDEEDLQIQNILKKREFYPLHFTFDPKDPDVQQFLKIDQKVKP